MTTQRMTMVSGETIFYHRQRIIRYTGYRNHASPGTASELTNCGPAAAAYTTLLAK